MVKKFLKKRSKRMPARRRYKIEKKVREHNRKLKREAKRNPNKRKNKKDPGVPNSFPFKEKILQEAAERKQQAEAAKERAKEERKKLRDEKRELESVTLSAEKRSADFENKEPKKLKTVNSSVDTSTKTYYKEFKKVVEAADVILEVLDARDPIGSRCPQVEQEVINSGTSKKLVLVLNKIDLIPKSNLLQWMKYLRNEFPTVAFKASTQNQRKHLSQSSASITKSKNSAVQTSQCLGANILMKLLGNYCRTQDMKATIRVGVVGFPNVGKSSIINSLKRNRVCNTGAVPGVTKSMQEIQLDKHIVLLDSPGIVLAKSSDTFSVLRNAVKVEQLPDPIPAVEAILQRTNHNDLLLLYNIPTFNSTQEFLALLSKRFGRLKRGGVPDIEKAARLLIHNWNTGKIKFYTHPPEIHELPQYLSTEIVQEMSKPFILEGLTEEEEELYKGLAEHVTSALHIESVEPTECQEDRIDMDTGVETKESEQITDNHENEEMPFLSERVQVTCEAPSVLIKTSQNDKIPKRLQKKVKLIEEAQKLEGNQKMGRAAKVLFKKLKKDRKRREKAVTNLADSLVSSLKLNSPHKTNDSYDFKTDYHL